MSDTPSPSSPNPAADAVQGITETDIANSALIGHRYGCGDHLLRRTYHRADRQAGFVQRNINLSLYPAFGIPFGFTVADQTNSGGCRDFLHGFNLGLAVHCGLRHSFHPGQLKKPGILSIRGGLHRL